MRDSLRLFVGFLAMIWTSASATSAAEFTGLGDFPGGDYRSTAAAVSADGSVVVGTSRVGTGVQGNRAFYWTPAGGMELLGGLPGMSSYWSWAKGVSADGSTIVGQIRSSAGNQAYRWTKPTGMIALADLPGGQVRTDAYSVSADGSVIAGEGYDSAGAQAVRWNAQGQILRLGNLPGASQGYGLSVSADGSTIVGYCQGLKGFRWTPAEGMLPLGDLPGGPVGSQALDVSADGSVVVGGGAGVHSTGSASFEAFRWTQESGSVSLGDLPGGPVQSTASAVSADGAVVVGRSNMLPSWEGGDAFIWDAEHGMRDLQDVLIHEFDLGASLQGWNLYIATDVSADGRVIVGEGTNPAGQTEAWRAVVPEPPSVILVSIAVLGLLAYARRIRNGRA